MKDKKRIKRILNLIEVFWNRHPDMRLSQIISCMNYANCDIFYLEDEVLEDRLNMTLMEG